MSTIGNDHVDLGAYALGLLEDQDKVTFEAHLATCDACRTELPSLSPIAGLLRGMDPVEVPGDVKPPVDLLRRRASASRRGRRRLTIASAAAAVVLVGGGIGVGLAVASGPAPATTTLTGQLHTATNAANGVTGTIGLAAKGWGLRSRSTWPAYTARSSASLSPSPGRASAESSPAGSSRRPATACQGTRPTCLSRAAPRSAWPGWHASR